MNETINQLEGLLASGFEYVSQATELELSQKPSPEKWSKKEIMGHLLDSALNNLQRFTEIQVEEKPYKIRKYRQDEWVEANQYQASKIEEIVICWLALNRRIVTVMKNQTETTLSYQIVFNGNDYADLNFLMKDYVDHLEHHLTQLTQNG
ncbi:MAG: DinB family protein [Bacteroidia bacterium]|nr:DinB family protein [Bacteroidia bacterium]